MSPLTPGTKFFVKSVKSWKLLTNATKSPILDVAMVLDTSLLQNTFQCGLFDNLFLSYAVV